MEHIVVFIFLLLISLNQSELDRISRCVKNHLNRRSCNETSVSVVDCRLESTFIVMLALELQHLTLSGICAKQDAGPRRVPQSIKLSEVTLNLNFY